MTVELAIGAIALCPMVIKLSRQLRNAYKSVKYARRELEELTNEMDIFTDLYSEFLKACSARKKSRKRVASSKTRLVAWTRRAINDYKELLHKVDALARHPIYKHTILETALAPWKWFFSTNYLVYLRASLSVARQSMVSFTNIYNMESLDEQLFHLRSVMTRQQRHDIEVEYGMTKEQRIEEVQEMRDAYEMRQMGLPALLMEAQEKVLDYRRQSRNDGVAEQARQIRRLVESIGRCNDSVLPADTEGNRPPISPPRPSHGATRHRPDSSLTSQSTATTSTRSSQPSRRQAPAPESPLTSPEPFVGGTTILIHHEEEETFSILNFCQICSGTCTNTEAHNTSILPCSFDSATDTLWCIRNTPPGLFSAQTSNTPRPSTMQTLKVPTNQASDSDRTPAPRPRPHSRQPLPPQPSVEPAEESEQPPQTNLPTMEEEEDDPQDEAPQEETLTEEQAGESRTSIWKATGGFEGDMPKGLRIRRKRSRSPQDFW